MVMVLGIRNEFLDVFQVAENVLEHQSAHFQI